METRHGHKFDWLSCEEGIHPSTHYTSITMITRICVKMHSSAPFPVDPELPTSFLDVLHLYKDCKMWDNLSLDGDGSWIWEGIAAGLVLVAHNGSYMSTEAPHMCSAGVVLYCKTGKK